MTFEVVVATKNPDKIPEIEAILSAEAPAIRLVKGLDWPDVDETGETLADNALLKARTVAVATGYAAIGDDTGLEVDALDGAPGVCTARFAGPDATYAENRAALLEALEGCDERAARFRTAAALVTPDGTEVVAHGAVEGAIAVAERGIGGFGYDCVFEVAGVTFAEMDDGEKNRISHRSRALVELARGLRRAGLL